VKLHHPFRTALIATLGVGVGILIITSVQSLSTILLYVGTALFLAEAAVGPRGAGARRRGREGFRESGGCGHAAMLTSIHTTVKLTSTNVR